jgi:hypothetical protein
MIGFEDWMPGGRELDSNNCDVERSAAAKCKA